MAVTVGDDKGFCLHHNITHMVAVNGGHDFLHLAMRQSFSAMSIVKPISTLPVFVTPEERKEVTSSTPLSFDSIPPTLRHKEENVSISFDPPHEDWQEARGTLYIIERYVASNYP